MSRFFKGSDSESESSSSEEEIIKERPAVGKPAFQFSDDEVETKRVVRSAKDKRFEEIRNNIKQLKNHKKIKDMSNVLSDFEALGRAFEKARKVVDKEGVPHFYIRCLAELEDFVFECWEDREGRKQMSKNNAKGLTTLRQKLRKYNREFENEIFEYKANPDEAEDDEGKDEDEFDKSDSEDDEDEDGAQFKKHDFKDEPLTRTMKDEESDSDDSMWGTSSDETDSESDVENLEGYTAAMFLKKGGPSDDKIKEEKDDKKRKEKKDKRTKKTQDGEDEGEWEEVKGGIPMVHEKPKMFAKDTEVNHEAVVKKLNEIVSARGKKGTDRSEQIELLKELLAITVTNNLGPAIYIKIQFNILSAIYDYNPNIATCMKPEMWLVCLNYLPELLNMLIDQPDIVVGENILEESEQLETAPYRVRGCILTMVERLDEEFTKMLQGCDAHSTEYVERLQDEGAVCDIMEKLMKYIEPRGTTEELCRIYLRRIEHVYYKFDYAAFESQKQKESETESEKTDIELNEEGSEPTPATETPEQLVDRLCKFVYAKDNTDRLRTRAILCHIYHHALHDRWFQARDLMLMSHLQDSIVHSDVRTQILYNRTMVQLGLCAFRKGMTRDAHNSLVDIQSGGRAKELLAQGLLLQRQHERTPEQEKIEKRRLLPYHMHINLELLECVYLVSAMLMEIPYMAAHEMDARRRMISKNFHHVMRMSERQTLTGPPESMREHVVAASKAMKTGDWKSCKNYIINEKMNTKVWDLFYEKDVVRNMIIGKIQEESLRTYLFTYSSVYDSLCLKTLSEMFELEPVIVHSIISKMIINEELMASLDEPTQTVVMHRTEPSRLQSLALQLSEKVSSLVDNNERIMELKQGNLFYQKPNKEGWREGGGRQWNDGGGGGGRGWREGGGRGWKDGGGGGGRGWKDGGGGGGGRGYQQGGYQNQWGNRRGGGGRQRAY